MHELHAAHCVVVCESVIRQGLDVVRTFPADRAYRVVKLLDDGFACNGGSM